MIFRFFHSFFFHGQKYQKKHNIPEESVKCSDILRIFANTYQRGRLGFDSMKNRYVSMSGAVKRPVNPGHKILVGENNYALAA